MNTTKAGKPRKRRPGAGAKLGNKHGVILKDADIRQLAYKSYCEHLAKGKSRHSWTFEHGEYRCCYKTFEKYLDNTTEFPPEYRDHSFAKGYGEWESITEDSAKGVNTKANTASLQMVMRNKFGWDKQEKEINVDVSFNKLFNETMNQIKDSQSSLKREAISTSSEQKS